ncbi:unnamed protein product, partial [Didymodactylos carnosus]
MNTIKALVELLTPKSIKDIDAFVGAAGFYRKFVPRFSVIVSPLNKLTRNRKQKFCWHQEQQEAFVQLKKVLSTEPLLLSFPDSTFTVETDRCPLCNFHRKSAKNGRVDRWSIGLGEYDILEIKYKRGKCNCDADLMSGYPPIPTNTDDTIITRNVKNKMDGTTFDNDAEHTAEVNVLTRSAARAQTTKDAQRITTPTDTHPNPGTNKKSRQLRPKNKTLTYQVSNNLVSAQSSTIKQQSSSNPAPSSSLMFDFDINKSNDEQHRDKSIQQKINQIKQNPQTTLYEVVDDTLYKIVLSKG